jgi:hypothetical protein
VDVAPFSHGSFFPTNQLPPHIMIPYSSPDHPKHGTLHHDSHECRHPHGYAATRTILSCFVAEDPTPSHLFAPSYKVNYRRGQGLDPAEPRSTGDSNSSETRKLPCILLAAPDNLLTVNCCVTHPQTGSCLQDTAFQDRADLSIGTHYCFHGELSLSHTTQVATHVAGIQE